VSAAGAIAGTVRGATGSGTMELVTTELPSWSAGDAGDGDGPRRGRARGLSLLWWAFLGNALVLVVAAALLIVTPVTISAPIAIAEVAILLLGLTALLLANIVLLRRLLLPLRRLTDLMGRVDPMRPGRRLEALGTHHAEVGALADAFNAMLDRLELERRESTRRVLAAQEGERLRIARELHDELGQVLTAAAIEAERAADAGPQQRAEALRDTAGTIRASLDDVRRIARELRPEALDDLGLVNALMALCRRVAAQSEVRVRTHFGDGLPPIGGEVELVVYRVAQESLTNALRHAGAQTVDVALRADADTLELVVSDDGRGLPEPLPAGGTGIDGMRERALLVGGRLTIGAAEGGGTEVRLEVPRNAPPWASP
jgi:two-component system sensor histidine kinase UhpB